MGDLIERASSAVARADLGYALALGVVLTLAALLWAGAARRRDPAVAPAPIGGLVVVVAAGAVLLRRSGLDLPVVAGVLLVTAGASARLRRVPLLAVAAVAVGAALVVSPGSLPGWARIVVAAVASIGAVAAAHTERAWREEAVTPTLLLLAAAGIFAAVPDTEEALALLGATLPVALVGWPTRLVSLGAAPAAGTLALTAWVIGTGARGRPLAVLGAAACLALLVAWPFGRRLARRWRLPSRAVGVPPILAVQALLVVTSSRVAGISFDAAIAVPVSVGCGLAAVASAALLDRRR